MAGGWTRDGAVQEQIDASIADAVKLARNQLPQGESLTHCKNVVTRYQNHAGLRLKAFSYVFPVKAK